MIYLTPIIVILFLLQTDIDISEQIKQLNADDPFIRKVAIMTIGKRGSEAKKAVRHLISRMSKETEEDVAIEIFNALRSITGKNLPNDKDEWTRWWFKEGEEYVYVDISKAEISKLSKEIETLSNQTILEREKLKMELQNSMEISKTEIRTETRILTIVVACLAIIFILVMLFFIGYVSSKLKEWREIMKNVDAYLKRGEELTKRVDNITGELDIKRNEILDVFEKAKNDNETEVARYIDELEKRVESNLREGIQLIKENAERELQYTLGELKTQIDFELKKTVATYKDKLSKEINNYIIDILIETAKTLKDLSHFEKAIDYYRRALQINSNNYWIYYEIAVIYALLKKEKEAIETLKILVVKDSSFKERILQEPAFKKLALDEDFKKIVYEKGSS